MTKIKLICIYFLLAMIGGTVDCCPPSCTCRIHFYFGNVVDCSSRNLLVVPTSFPSDTNMIYLNNNNISDITETFSGLENLKYLYLGNNNISNVKGAFSGLGSLLSLRLGNNNISNVKDAFSGLGSLQWLHFDNNKISNVKGAFSGLGSLETLHLDNNKISNVKDAFSGLGSLRYLYIRSNPIACKCNLAEELWDLQRAAITGSCTETSTGNVHYLSDIASKRNFDECLVNPCHNGAGCNDTDTRTCGTYKCTCAAGWRGELCTVNVDECSSSPCINGDCYDEVNGFRCWCIPGWTGTLCETNIDDCLTKPCLNEGTCTDYVNTYNCTCIEGFTGKQCEISAFPTKYIIILCVFGGLFSLGVVTTVICIAIRRARRRLPVRTGAEAYELSPRASTSNGPEESEDSDGDNHEANAPQGAIVAQHQPVECRQSASYRDDHEATAEQGASATAALHQPVECRSSASSIDNNEASAVHEATAAPHQPAEYRSSALYGEGTAGPSSQ